jgi:23S rRNA pseudouridine1911/1915/1917 synthase
VPRDTKPKHRRVNDAAKRAPRPNADAKQPARAAHGEAPRPVTFSDTTRVAGSDAPLDRHLRGAFPGASWNAVRSLVESGKVTVDGAVVREPSRGVRAGSEIRVSMRAPRARDNALPRELIAHVDTQIVVVRKPAGISTVPFDEHETGTLSELVEAALKRKGGSHAPLGIVHRIDKETSGLVVFARTLTAKRALKQQFRVHSVRRRYLALAHGRVAAGTLHSRLIKDRGDGRRGSTENPNLGREAVTHVRVVEALRGATLIECRLETGRTHQIRIHLAEEGHPLLGERVYSKNFEGALITAPRLMLHAFELGFEHPTTGEALHFEEKMPDDMRNVLETLRG